MRQPRRSVSVPLLALSVAAATVLISTWSGPGSTQTLPRLFQGSFAPGASKPGAPRLTVRSRRAKAVLSALNAPALSLNLFDNTEIAVTRTKVDRPRADRLVWHGRGDDGSQVALAVVKGALAGTVYTFGQTFDVVGDGNGLYRVSELDSTAFPTDDPEFDAVPQADVAVAGGTTSVTPTMSRDGVPQIDVMVVWTPAARNAVGGTQAAIESLIQSAVANANLAYSNSGVNAQLRLVHAEEVAFTEGSITTDLSSLTTAGDGVLDRVQTLRDQYGADIVTLLGNGYAAAGTCGSSYIMSTPTTSFAQWAYNVVDQSCAAGYLSYAHEVGHNEGLQHDPANSGSTSPAYPYAHGYQDPSGAFRTVLSYGSAQRVPFFSNPSVLYNGLPTGNTNQKNAVALNLTVPIVTQFRPAADATVSGGSTPPPPPPPPPCSYSVSPTSLSFSTAAGSAGVTITTTSGCSWSSSSATAWVGALGTGTASGASKVTVLQNTGGSRSSSVTIAGRKITVSQQGVKVARGKGKP